MQILWVLILVNVLISYSGFKNPSFFNRYKFHVGSILKGEQIRLWSSGFLHVDSTHLLFNMFTLYIFGKVVLMDLGGTLFIILYAFSLFVGNYFTFRNHKSEAHYSAVGASGAVSGIVYASILLFPEMKLALLIFPIPLPGYVFGIGYLAYSLFGMKKQIGNIGHAAHFGGAVAGLLGVLIIKPEIIIDQTLLVGLLLVPVIAYAVLRKRGAL
jgi:membrane associated rhomboid family serine protease